MENENNYKISETATVPLAYHELCMQRNARNIKNIVIGWAASVIAIVALFVFMWLQYDYVAADSSTTLATGVYALIDSEGNVISNDLSAEDISNILPQIINGDSIQEND